MKKIVQVLVASFAVGMLASMGVATAEIYFVSLSEDFGSSSIAVIDIVTDSVVVQPQGTGSVSADCEPDGIFLDPNGKYLNFDPPYPGEQQVGVLQMLHINDDLAGNSKLTSRFTGITYTFENTNLLVEPTTVTLEILCLKAQFMTVGGLQIPTDMTALLLGYTILNSYWIAPTAVGIGLGIYLVKRRF